MAALFYALMLGFFFTHEMDAMRRHEWRVLPITSFLPDALGKQVFLWAHVPLISVIWLYGTDPNAIFSKALSAFAIVHIGLHWAFRKHQHYEFNNLASWTLILGAGLCGAAHLLASF